MIIAKNDCHAPGQSSYMMLLVIKSMRLLLTLLLCATFAIAQTATGTIGVVAEDSTQAVVQRAVVTVTNKATGLTRTGSSGERGEFQATFLPAGEYSMFVDLKPGAWTLIFSNWPAQKEFNPGDKTALFGADGYTPDKDVLRARMQVDVNAGTRVDQLTIYFVDVTRNGGKLAIAWDTTNATVPFTVGK